MISRVLPSDLRTDRPWGGVLVVPRWTKEESDPGEKGVKGRTCKGARNSENHSEGTSSGTEDPGGDPRDTLVVRNDDQGDIKNKQVSGGAQRRGGNSGGLTPTFIRVG